MSGEAGGKKKDHEWAAHIWIGSDLFAWLRLLWKGRCSFGLKQLHLLPLCTGLGLIHTFERYRQDGLYRERMKSVDVKPPVFILGHWRTGTTLLHELLIADPRHGYPDTAQCFNPCHDLLSDKLIKKYLKWLLPSRRQMDNMRVGWDRPQEDEFALALLGAPSPYNTLAFPNRGPVDNAAYDLDGLPQVDRERWARTFEWFVRSIAIKDPRRLILKSPPHTCRVPTLLKLFPDARFIYLVRDPFVVYSSTVNLWKTLYRMQGLHEPNFDGLEEQVLDRFVHFHQRMKATRGLIPQGRLVELRYEDLTADPMGQTERIYRELELGEFEVARPHVQQYLAETARYEKNKWSLPDDVRQRIVERWGSVIREQGYAI